jgi:hypothetical protein
MPLGAELGRPAGPSRAGRLDGSQRKEIGTRGKSDRPHTDLASKRQAGSRPRPGPRAACCFPATNRVEPFQHRRGSSCRSGRDGGHIDIALVVFPPPGRIRAAVAGTPAWTRDIESGPRMRSANPRHVPGAGRAGSTLSPGRSSGPGARRDRGRPNPTVRDATRRPGRGRTSGRAGRGADRSGPAGAIGLT